MLYKGIIENKIDQYTYKIRVPRFDKSSSSSSGRQYEDLSTAVVSCLPGISPYYNAGDVVIIEYEDNLNNLPIILGLLFRSSNETNSTCEINTLKLNVENDCTLPANSSVGNVTSTDMNYISSETGGLNNRLSLIDDRIDLIRAATPQGVEEMKLDIIDLKSRMAGVETSVYSHVGMVIQSTTLDTELKVKLIYGGTTWTLLENKFLVGAGDLYNINSTGGSATHIPSGSIAQHILTTSEVPAHTHTRGTMNITGGVAPAHSSGVCWYNVAGNSGAFYTYESVGNCGNPSISAYFTGDHMLGFDASRNWTGETSSVGEGGSHNHGFTGTELNTLPPYKAVYIWERTA